MNNTTDKKCSAAEILASLPFPYMAIQPEMEKMVLKLPKIAKSDSTVLILGESGTGKELLTKAVHYLSNRKKGPFIAVNCAAIPEDLLESELFGYQKGAFTGAQANKKGRFELADHGTLFLDEIGDMSMKLQAKLLRVLQDREIEPLGSTKPCKVDVRIIAATNRKLEQLIEDGSFRQDLYYRLNVLSLNLPPLRERKEEIPHLLVAFLDKYNRLKDGIIENISAKAMTYLQNYNWPGNIRELENLVESVVVLCENPVVDIDDLPIKIKQTELPTADEKHALYEINRELATQFKEQMHSMNECTQSQTSIPSESFPLDDYLGSIEKEILINTLKKHQSNQTKAAKHLQIKRTTLIQRLKKYKLID